MKKKILKSTTMLVILSVLLTFLVMNFVVYNKTYEEMKSIVNTECHYIRDGLNEAGDGYLTQDISDISSSRITLIDTDGDVLFDSAGESYLMENHGDRPEVQQALAQGYGSDARFSDTLSKQAYYYAMRLKDGRIIRVSNTVDTVLTNVFSGFVLVLLLIAGIGVASLAFIRRWAEQVTAPINNMDLNHPLENVTYDELSPLLVRLDQQNKQIKDQIVQLRQNQEEYLAITEYMDDGLIVTNRHVVLSVNRAAQNLFHVKREECVGHDIITVSRNEDLKDAFQKALSGESEERLMDIGGKVYQLHANPVRVGNEKVSGTVLLLLDVTEKQKAEVMRREFSANVSHELKTPLMSISGYAELIENNMVKPADIANFAGRIHSEAARLSSLVADIIKLSRLDEDDGTLPMETVDLYTLAQEVAGRLSLRAAETDITLEVTGKPQQIQGVRQVLYEMLYNLSDNAIKYNKPGGYVKIDISEVNGHARVKIADNGIGIAKEDQERIFERFYRVDKSHSRETGGTGLGLSIVKHGALLHDARLMIDSTPDVGTTIRILF
ncbi:MAG: ATP-binding protein [Lachnospiraceae bacterium]|nr:ATP-binding protein [Lachnospiraceae bacterium]